MKRSRSRSAPSTSTRRRRSPRRVATLYDAVAGRVGYEGFLTDQPTFSKGTDYATSSKVPVYPEEILFRRRNAPIRYAETDEYFAHEKLPADALPDSDLLKALHVYASQFFAKATVTKGKWDWRSLDETALLGLGILMEEAMREALGETGDLAFIEAQGDGIGGLGVGRDGVWDGRRFRRSVLERRGRNENSGRNSRHDRNRDDGSEDRDEEGEADGIEAGRGTRSRSRTDGDEGE